MTIVLSAQMIARALFEFDPLNTCCGDEASFDQYAALAESVEGRLRQGFSLKQALVLELDGGEGDEQEQRAGCLDALVSYLKGKDTDEPATGEHDER